MSHPTRGSGHRREVASPGFIVYLYLEGKMLLYAIASAAFGSICFAMG
jgi:hypothetical protein